ncbi:RNA-binding protein 3 [Sciurus carolinensis]|uniref:RNA-binding protein 3 n=1 Tax=Sciurus carolinensis TaxID=30640 RepID=A0AA41T6R4_SCICA|nr:RNA-binding protein 3 [Sciurus carolinensis]
MQDRNPSLGQPPDSRNVEHMVQCFVSISGEEPCCGMFPPGYVTLCQDSNSLPCEEGKLSVGGHILNTDEQVLKDHFSSFGPISEVIVKDQKARRSQRFGFITITNPEHATDAMKAMNGESLGDHQIHVDNPGKSA